jgi:hypothetical protein
VWPIGRGKIGGHSIGASAGFANFCDNCIRCFGAACEMYKHLGACLGECECAGAPDPARSAGDECGFS